jgi:hypothetical protein
MAPTTISITSWWGVCLKFMRASHCCTEKINDCQSPVHFDNNSNFWVQKMLSWHGFGLSTSVSREGFIQTTSEPQSGIKALKVLGVVAESPPHESTRSGKT